MPSTTAIAATAAGAESTLISIADGSSIQVHLSQPLAGGEYVAVEHTPDDGTTYSPLQDPKWKGNFLRHGVSRNVLAGPGDFKLVKSATSNAIAVYYD